KVGDRTMKCHLAGGHGNIDFKGALVGSCNPAFVKIGADLGTKHFYEYFMGFGLTQKTGIDLPGENQSQYYTDKQMGVVELASCSFGQSMALTPLQLVTGVSAVVNGGKLVTPHVVKDVLDENNNVIKSIKPEIKRQVISTETSKTMRDLMEAVVDIKGGSNATIKGYRIGGKSGTSQKQNPGDSEEARIGSYVAVAPIDKPEIAVLIMIDEPTATTEVYGSVIAAPTCALILSETLPYLGYTAEEASKLEATVPYLLKKGILEASSKLSSAGLPKPKVIGNGDTVIKQVPISGAKIPRDGTVILYTSTEPEELKEIPNVVGLSPALAKNKLTMAGFNVVIKGEAVKHNKSKISNQSILAGVKTPIGTVVEITCIKSDTD
ncbi:MAG: penicillin-binding transpeptidase domain-containing protein, partial [Oscillospiraceae bacterium]